MMKLRVLAPLSVSLALLILNLQGCAPEGAISQEKLTPEGKQSAPRRAGLNLVSKEIKEESKRLKYEISAEFPQIVGSTNARVERFNREVRNLVSKKVRDFKRDVSEREEIPGLSDVGSDLGIGYSVGVATDSLVSIEFGVGSYYRGAAHPNHYTEVVNYDLKSGRRLKLADLFKPASNYLRVISDYCINDLKKQARKEGPEPTLLDEEIEEGASASLKNYESWTITEKGLMITFDAYQVGPYVAGPQTVLIPYAALKEIVDPNGPLAPFLKS